MANVLQEWQAIVDSAITVSEERMMTDAEKKKTQTLQTMQRLASFSKRPDYQMIDLDESVVIPRKGWRFFGNSSYPETCVTCRKIQPIGSEVWQRLEKPKIIVCESCFAEKHPHEHRYANGMDQT